MTEDMSSRSCAGSDDESDSFPSSFVHCLRVDELKQNRVKGKRRESRIEYGESNGDDIGF